MRRTAPNSKGPLISKRLLLGTDEHLHASGGKTKVFFRPVRTGQDSEVVPDRRIEEIPERLKEYIAFLHKSIVTHLLGSSGRLQNTPVQKYLADDLVNTFHVQEIVQGVLLRNTPKDLPVTYTDSRSSLCQAIFQWGLKLAYSLIEQGKGENIIRLLGRLPTPCIGGWFPLGETSFGPGWKKTTGSILNDYFLSMGNQACREARYKILLPPSDPLWEGMGEIYQDTLREAGVFDGLRLFKVKPGEWESGFTIAGWQQQISLPSQQPLGISESFWQKYKDYIAEDLTPYFGGTFKYKVQDFFLFPGFDEYHESREKSRFLLTKLIFSSISSWSENLAWKNTVFKKEGGQPHSFTPYSPLFFFLERIQWIYDKVDEQLLAFCPSERWYINSNILSGRAKQFSHLKPYPAAIRKLLDGYNTIVEELKKLGMPVYNPSENVTDPILLDSLANSIIDRKYSV